MTTTGRAKIFGEGHRIVRPRDRNEETGEYFGPDLIVAVVLERGLAEALRDLMKEAGVPARIKERQGGRGGGRG